MDQSQQVIDNITNLVKTAKQLKIPQTKLIEIVGKVYNPTTSWVARAASPLAAKAGVAALSMGANQLSRVASLPRGGKKGTKGRRTRKH